MAASSVRANCCWGAKPSSPRSASGPEGVVTRHVCANLAVEAIDADHARGVMYFLLYKHDHAAAGTDAGKPAPLGPPETLGEYHDEYLRTAEGWRIARRVAKGVFRRA
ncbi:MAG: nuclear transport factor 2 family protein [Betaproteobacteria bacterium]|nr:nuclear transport factor 2 family protein [Betaproteobacteria bacterium]